MLEFDPNEKASLLIAISHFKKNQEAGVFKNYLIIAQRTYQANTQTVKTQDQVVQALINMR